MLLFQANYLAYSYTAHGNYKPCLTGTVSQITKDTTPAQTNDLPPIISLGIFWTRIIFLHAHP